MSYLKFLRTCPFTKSIFLAQHDHTADGHHAHEASVMHSPRKAQRITNQTGFAPPREEHGLPPVIATSAHLVDVDEGEDFHDPVIPPINAYGTFDPNKLSSSQASSSRHHLRRSASQGSHLSNASSLSQHQPLLPSSRPQTDTVMDKVSGDLIPFAGFVTMLKQALTPRKREPVANGVAVRLVLSGVVLVFTSCLTGS